MPRDAQPLSLSRQVADIQKRLRQHTQVLTKGGFDPNVDPVVIGSGADGSGAGGGVVIGEDAFNNGTNSTAVGRGATTNGTQQVALGLFATCAGAAGHTTANAVAIGHNANVALDADSAVAIGNGAIAAASQSVAIGPTAHTDSTATESVAIGYNAESVGAYNAVYGPNAFANATAQYGVALGYNALCEADSSTALGSGADAAFTDSTAVGVNAATTKASQIMLGTDAEFVEIPGNGAANGLVLTDTATGTRYLVQITSGALVLNTAP